MKNIRALLEKTEFHFALQIFYFVLFVWPFLTIQNQSNNHRVFYFLFGSWLSLIILHLIMDLISKNEEADKE